MKFTKLAGQKFGRLTILRRLGILQCYGREQECVMCRCDCGNERVLPESYVKSGHTRSCGCAHGQRLKADDGRVSHDLCGTRIHSIWSKMKGRCYCVTDAKYPRYGGRGIKICERWQKLENFYADMGDPPSGEYSIDRIDNDGNYEPENCRWATTTQQQRNKSTNHRFEYQGKLRPISEIAELCGIDHQTLYHRLVEAELPVEEATTRPLKVMEFTNVRDALHEYRGEHRTLKEWAALYNLKYKSLMARMKAQGKTLAQALEMSRGALPPIYTYEGKEFTQPELAAHFGITTEALYSRIKRGTLIVTTRR